MTNAHEGEPNEGKTHSSGFIRLPWKIALLLIAALAIFHVTYDVSKRERPYQSEYTGDEKIFDFYMKYRPISENQAISVGIYALDYGKDQVPARYQHLIITGNGLLKEQLPNLNGIPSNPLNGVIDRITGERILWEGLRVDSDRHPWLIFLLNVFFVWGVLSLGAISVARIVKAFLTRDGRKFQDTMALFGLVFLLAITQVALISIVFPDFKLI